MTMCDSEHRTESEGLEKRPVAMELDVAVSHVELVDVELATFRLERLVIWSDDTKKLLLKLY